MILALFEWSLSNKWSILCGWRSNPEIQRTWNLSVKLAGNNISVVNKVTSIQWYKYHLIFVPVSMLFYTNTSLLQRPLFCLSEIMSSEGQIICLTFPPICWISTKCSSATYFPDTVPWSIFHMNNMNPFECEWIEENWSLSEK